MLQSIRIQYAYYHDPTDWIQWKLSWADTYHCLIEAWKKWPLREFSLYFVAIQSNLLAH